MGIGTKAPLFTSFFACAIMQIKWIMADANLFRRLKMGVRTLGGGGWNVFATQFSAQYVWTENKSYRPALWKRAEKEEGWTICQGKKLEKITAKTHACRRCLGHATFAKRDSITWRIFNVNPVLSVCALIILKMFCCHVDSKLKCKVSACFFDTTAYSKMSIILSKQSRKAACDHKITIRNPPMTCKLYI